MRQAFSLLFLFLLLFSMASLSYSQEDPNCENAAVPRLSIGSSGRVFEGDANNVRTAAETAAERIGIIPGGDDFLVLEGPVCADGFTWWRVDYEGLIGWTVEGTANEYFVTPIDSLAPTPMPAAPIPAIEYPLSAENALAVGLQARVDVAGLNIRANPSRAAAMISQTVANEIVEIVGDRTEAEGLLWWQIEQQDGTVGWVVEQFSSSFEETDYDYSRENIIQTLYPLCPYTTERLSFIVHPYIYTSARDGSQRCVLHKLQTSDVYTTWGELKYMVNDVYWSPDGDEFFFIDFAYDVNCCIYRLYSLSVDASRLTVLTPSGDVDWAAWSPDGERIALVLNEQAWVMNRDGTNPVRLSNTENRIDYVAWYPDNQTVFYVETIPENPNAVQTFTRTESILHAVGADLSNPRELYRINGDLEIRDISLSSDGRSLVAVLTEFNEYLEPVGGGAYLYDTETWEREALNTYWTYLFSPDGQFVAISDEESHILNIATDESQSLGAFSPSSWSADGQFLYSSEGAGFVVYELATGETNRFLEEEGEPLEGSYSDGISSVREQGTD